MAQRAPIPTTGNAAKITIDGNEIIDIESYFLQEDHNGVLLGLPIAITGSVEMQCKQVNRKRRKEATTWH